MENTFQYQGETTGCKALFPHHKGDNAFTYPLLAATHEAISKIWTGAGPLCKDCQWDDGENIDLDKVQISSFNAVRASSSSLLCGMVGMGKTTIIPRAVKFVPFSKVPVLRFGSFLLTRLSLASLHNFTTLKCQLALSCPAQWCSSEGSPLVPLYMFSTTHPGLTTTRLVTSPRLLWTKTPCNKYA